MTLTTSEESCKQSKSLWHWNNGHLVVERGLSPEEAVQLWKEIGRTLDCDGVLEP
jgi:hypothetical protein